MVPDMIRAQRLLLSVLNGNGDAALLVAAEMNDCIDCRGRMLTLFLTITASLVAIVNGSRENAVKRIEEGLLSDLDAQ